MSTNNATSRPRSHPKQIHYTLVLSASPYLHSSLSTFLSFSLARSIYLSICRSLATYTYIHPTRTAGERTGGRASKQASYTRCRSPSSRIKPCHKGKLLRLRSWGRSYEVTAANRSLIADIVWATWTFPFIVSRERIEPLRRDGRW